MSDPAAAAAAPEHKHLVHFETHDLHSDLVFATEQTLANALHAAKTPGEDMAIQHYREAIVNSFPRVMNRIEGMKRVTARAAELCPKTKVVPAFVWTCDTIKCRSARGRTLLVSAKCVSKDKDHWEAAACLWCRDMRIGCDITNVRLMLREDAEDILPAARKRKRVIVDDDEHRSSDRSTPQPYQRMPIMNRNNGPATPSMSPTFNSPAAQRVTHAAARASSSRPRNGGHEVETLKERLAHKAEMNKMLLKANEDKDKHLADKDRVIEAVKAENVALKARIATLEGHNAADQNQNHTLAQRVAALETSTATFKHRIDDVHAETLAELTEHRHQLAEHREQLADHAEQLAHNDEKYEWLVRNCSGFDLDADGNWVKTAEEGEDAEASQDKE
ncbi:uncharacterized protein LOC62_03G005185 [Vanrija pseudolonga]|uniref:Uncharacterized protein n=1 Tax=Vanrija pseudolonga TaxID=143232 RepID=A0AAF0Y963_9TREE|nr:hypothetical protein LOC62_03G005185 [Vanrija pseudolonga]